MSRSKIFLSVVTAVAATALASAGSLDAAGSAPKVARVPDPKIHITFNNDSYDDIEGGSTVIMPMSGKEPCYMGTEHFLICNDETQSRFGNDKYGSYWKSVKASDSDNGGLIIEPNEAITDAYTVAVTFSMSDVLTAEANTFARIITYSIGRDDGASILNEDCGVYMIHTAELTEYSGPDGVVIGNYCDGVEIDSRGTLFSTSADSPDVITIAATRGSDGNTCLYLISDGGFANRIADCFTDPSDYVLGDHGNEINLGKIGFFMDDNGEVPDSAKLYDVRIWDRPLNRTMLDRAYTTPGSPSDVKVVKTGTKMKVAWKKPTHAAGARYLAEAYATDDGAEAVGSCSTSATNCKISLEPGTYWFAVTARNGDGWGVQSARVQKVVTGR